MTQARLVGGVVYVVMRAVWTSLVVLAPALGVWVASSLAAYRNGPVWLACAAGLLLFPVLPVLWDMASEFMRGRRKKKAGARILGRALRLLLAFPGRRHVGHVAPVLIRPFLIGLGFALAQRGHDAEDRRAFDAAGDGGLRDGTASLRGGDVELNIGADAGEGDVLRGGPDKAAREGLFERADGGAEACSAEQEDMTDGADAQLLRDAERVGGLASADDGEEVGHGWVVERVRTGGKVRPWRRQTLVSAPCRRE